MRYPSGALLRSLEAAGLPPETDLSALGVVESPGKYAGRKVTYLRVFDPKRAAGWSVDVFSHRAYQGLGAHPDLLLRTGFTERDGTVVLDWLPPSPDAAVPWREPADRAAHADVERYLFAGSR